MSNTVQDVLTEVQRTFGDEGGAQISGSDIIRWVNKAQEQIVQENDNLMETTAVANSVAKQSDYTTPVDMVSLRNIKYKGFRVRYMSFNDFNENLDGYAAAPGNSPYGPGIPAVFTVWNDVMTLFPTPSETITGGITIFYMRHPKAVVTVADSLDLPLQYFNAVVDYCLGQAYELDEDMDKQQFKMGEFKQKTMQLNDRNKGTQEYYPSITVLPQDQGFDSAFGLLGGY